MTAGRALTAALCALLVLPRLGGAQGLATAPERGCRPDSAAADTTGDSLFVWLPGRAPDQAPAEYDTQLAEERVALAKVAPLPPLGHRDRLPRPTLEYTPGAEWLRDASTLVWFQVRPDGRLSGLYLYSSSGWVALDLALERAVLRADSQRAFLPLPPALGGDPVNLWLAAGIGRTPFGLSVPLTRVRHATAPPPGAAELRHHRAVGAPGRGACRPRRAAARSVAQSDPHAEPSVHLVFALLLAAAQYQNVQVPDSVRAAVHRLFGTRAFAAERFGPTRWLEGGAAYTTVEPAAGGRGSEIVRYETATGERRVLVSARELTPPGDTVPLDLDDYTWSTDRSRLLLFTNTKRVWRLNTRGDYWVLDRRSERLTKIGGGAPASTLMYAKFSPSGDRVAYVRQGDLYVERLSDGAITRLTRGATKTLVNGMTDWVYEEEFGLRDGFRWSPDGRRIAYWQFDISGVGTFLLINDTDSLYPFTIPVQYPVVGTTNSAVRVGVVSAGGGRTTWLRVPGDPRNNYIPWLEWAGPGQVLLQHMNRRQNRDDLLLAEAATGAVTTVVAERDDAWLDLVESVPWVDGGGGRRFLWTSERDGWRHVYAVSRDGRDVRLLTPGAYDVVEVAAVDTLGGALYVIASPASPTERFLYRVPLGGGDPVRVTPAASSGTNSYDIAPDGRWAFHTASTADSPPVTDLVRLPAHEVVRTLVENRALKAAAAPLIARPTEFFRVTVDDSVALDGDILYPAGFDSTKAYPVLVYVYGEPAGQVVRNAWGGAGALWHRLIANLGYLVVSFDNQGTPSPRGRAWRKIVVGRIGTLSSRQQAEAVRALARSRHYVDSTRVAIWGWSGGGSSTLQAMFRYPDVYQVGMAVASVADEELYDTIYQERYMGLLPDDSAAYDRASAINRAGGLKGSLLIVHGSGDDNVHYAGDERLVNRLVSLGKPFDFMVYPNRSHCICEGEGTTEHVRQLLTRYLLTHLPAGAR